MRYHRQIPILVVIVLISTVLEGCFNHRHRDGDESIVGSGRTVTEERNVPSCLGVQIVGSGKVFLQQGTRQSIRVEADDNIIDRVVTRCENGYLITGLEEGSYSNTTVNIYVTLTAIEDVEILGAGDVVATGPIQGDALKCRIEGAGNISLDGNTVTQTIVIDGAGNIANFGLVCSRCTTTINGTGNCEVHVTQQLNGEINGVGNIVYEGNPPDVKTSINGIGKIYPH